jgi:hypothetical protein
MAFTSRSLRSSALRRSIFVEALHSPRSHARGKPPIRVRFVYSYGNLNVREPIAFLISAALDRSLHFLALFGPCQH